MTAFNYCLRCAAPWVDLVVEREPRGKCSAHCGYAHYDNPTPVVAAIVEHEGLAVLARKRRA